MIRVVTFTTQSLLQSYNYHLLDLITKISTCCQKLKEDLQVRSIDKAYERKGAIILLQTGGL